MHLPSPITLQSNLIYGKFVHIKALHYYLCCLNKVRVIFITVLKEAFPTAKLCMATPALSITTCIITHDMIALSMLFCSYLIQNCELTSAFMRHVAAGITPSNA